MSKLPHTLGDKLALSMANKFAREANDVANRIIDVARSQAEFDEKPRPFLKRLHRRMQQVQSPWFPIEPQIVIDRKRSRIGAFTLQLHDGILIPASVTASWEGLGGAPLQPGITMHALQRMIQAYGMERRRIANTIVNLTAGFAPPEELPEGAEYYSYYRFDYGIDAFVMIPSKNGYVLRTVIKDCATGGKHKFRVEQMQRLNLSSVTIVKGEVVRAI